MYPTTLSGKLPSNRLFAVSPPKPASLWRHAPHLLVVVARNIKGLAKYI
jgi:hypothetical protein